MQLFQSTDFVSQTDFDAAQAAAQAATTTATAKRERAEANRAAAAKRTAAKPAPSKRTASKPAPTTAKRAPVATASGKPAKPTQAQREAQQRQQADDRRLARDAAARAVGEFYSGASRPFKAASDRFADYNPSNAKAATARQAGLMLALITYGRGNMLSDGTFMRGGFIVPAKLVNPNAKPTDTVRAQPESGCLGNCAGRAIDYVSGPRTGREQAAAIYRLRPATALAEIQSVFGDKTANAARKLLASFPAKREAA